MNEQAIDRHELGAALYEHAQCWLTSGSIDGDSMAPAEMIENNRRHMPQLSGGTHLDCDCPLCRMMADDAEMLYPTFSEFDGHHLELDDEFAFSLIETREEWQREQQHYRLFSEETDGTDHTFGVTDMSDNPEEQEDAVAREEDEFDSVWKTSYVAPEFQAAGVSMLTLGFRTAELVSDLKCRDAAQQQVDDFNAAFDSVRVANCDPALRHLASEKMKHQLEGLAFSCPELINKMADLQSQLDDWSRQPA